MKPGPMQSNRAGLLATAGVLVCMLAAACASPVPPPVPRPTADQPMPPEEAPELPPGFQLVDRRGLVADVRPEVPVGGSGPRIEPTGGRSAYLVSWTGGACDEETVLTVTRSGADVELSLDVSLAVLAPGDACPSVGVLRTIRLTFAVPIPPDRISIRQPDPRSEPRAGDDIS